MSTTQDSSAKRQRAVVSIANAMHSGRYKGQKKKLPAAIRKVLGSNRSSNYSAYSGRGRTNTIRVPSGISCKPENKYFDENSRSTGLVTAAAGKVTAILGITGASGGGGGGTGIATGSTNTTRVGRVIDLMSLQVRGMITTGSATVCITYCIYLVYDRRPNAPGAVPGVTALLQTTDSANSFLNDDNSSRFKVIRRWHGHLGGSSAAGGNPALDNSFTRIDDWINLKGYKTVFTSSSSASGTYADTEEGGLLLFFVSDVATATNVGYTTQLFYRLRYLDCA